MTKFEKFIAGITLAGTALFSQAATVTSGSLSRTDASPIIYDSLNHLNWVGADATRALTYAQIVTATSAGGTYQDFHIANASEVSLFKSALTHGTIANCGGNVCTSSGTNWENILGETFANFPVLYGWDSDYDLGKYQIGANQFGAIEINTSYYFRSQRFTDQGYRGDTAWADSYAGASNYASVGWMLVSDHAVPEPSSAALAGLALAGLAAVRRRARRA